MELGFDRKPSITQDSINRQESGDLPLSPQWKFAFSRNPNQEPPKSALIGPWDGTAPPSFNTPQYGTKTAWEPTAKTVSRLDKWTPSHATGPALDRPAGSTPNDNRERPGRWREDERDGTAKPRDLERWGSTAADETSRWVAADGNTNRPAAPGADRWGGANAPAADGAGRGRGKPDERWAAREREPWVLPGMGEAEPVAKRTFDRWGSAANEGGAAGGDGKTDRWRSPGRVAGAAPGAGGAFESTAAAAGRGRGFTVGRGRSFKGAAPGAPGSGVDRWETGYPRTSLDGLSARSSGSALGLNSDGPVKRYSIRALQSVNNKLLNSAGGQLPMPSGVNLDYLELLPGEPLPEPDSSYEPRGAGSAPQADRVERWTRRQQAASPEQSGAEEAPAPQQGGMELQAKPLVSPHAFEADQWIYRDPQGNIQGPFTKMDILDWFQNGFFPPDLPIKSVVEPAEAPFVPLTVMLNMWVQIDEGRAPPGFYTGGQKMPQQQGPLVGQGSIPLGASGPMFEPALHSQHSGALHSQHSGPLHSQHSGPLMDQQLAPPAAQRTGSLLEQLLGKKLQDAPLGPTTSGFEAAPAPLGHHPHGVLLGGPGAPPLVSPFDQVLNRPEEPKATLFGATGFGGAPAGGPGPLNNPWAPSSLSAWMPNAAPAAPQSERPLFSHADPPIGGDVWGGFVRTQSGAVPPPSLFAPAPGQTAQHADSPRAMAGQAAAPLAPEVDPITKLARTLGSIGPHAQPPAPQQQPHPQQQPPQPQPHADAEASSPAPTAWNTPGVQQAKSLAEIQQEQAQEAARQAAAQQRLAPPAPPEAAPPAAAPAAAAAPAPSGGKAALSALPAPLQQFFAAAQRANMQTHPPASVDSFPPAPPPHPEPALEPASEPAAGAKKKDKGLKAEAAPPAPAPAPAAQTAESAPPKPESKPAPWAAVTAKVPATKTLREIQEEEAARAAAEAQRAQQLAEQQGLSAAPAPAGQAPNAWAKVAGASTAAPPASNAWGAAPAAAAAKPLNAILKEEEQRARTSTAPSTASQAAAGAAGAGPRGATLGEILERQLNPNPQAAPKAAAWGGSTSSTARPPATMREIMFEESALDLEGGAVDEDLSDVLPPAMLNQQPPRAAAPPPPPPLNMSSWGSAVSVGKSLREIQEEEERAARLRQQQAAVVAPPPPQPVARQPAPAAEEDMLFWDYAGPGQAAPVPPPPPRAAAPAAPAPAPVKPAAPAMTAAAIAAKNLPAAKPAAAAPGPAPAKPSAWPAAQTAAAVAARPAAAVMASSAARANGAAAAPTAKPAAAASASASAAARPAAASPAAAAAPSDDGATLMFGDMQVSAEFRDWCRGEMRRFQGNEDLSLVEFLMTLTSRVEVADYCQAYLGNKPGVSTFVADFLKRKDAEVARQSASKKKKGAAAPAAPAASNWQAPAAAAKGKPAAAARR